MTKMTKQNTPTTKLNQKEWNEETDDDAWLTENKQFMGFKREYRAT